MASIAALAGIPAALLAARWQTKAALAQAQTSYWAALDQTRHSARRAAYARLIAEATAFRREAWQEHLAPVASYPAPPSARALATFEALALARLDVPEALVPLVEQINVRAVVLNRLLTLGRADLGDEDIPFGTPGIDVKHACRGLRDAVNAFTDAARENLQAVSHLPLQYPVRSSQPVALAPDHPDGRR